MRILIVTGHRNLVGGVEKYLQSAITGLLGRGHAIGLLHENPAIPGWETIDTEAPSIARWCLEEMDPGAIFQSIAKWKPDVVYSHGLHGAQSIPIERALLDQYPAVLYVHNYDRTCATGRKCHSFPQVQTCTRQIGPMCLLLHYPRRCGGWNPGIMWQRYLRHRSLNALLPYHRAVLVASRHMYAELERHGIEPGKLHRIALPAAEFVSSTSAPVAKALSGRILFIGRLTDLKGVEYLIQAIPRAAQKLRRSLSLTIAGDGPEHMRLRDLGRQTGTAINFAGWVGTDEKTNLIRQADLLAVPSLWPEPFGLVGVEAGSLGVPSAGYAVGGIPDWLIAGETGEIAPGDPPTVDGLAEAIDRAFSSQEHYSKLCTGAWKMAQNFTLASHLDRLETILEAEAAEPGLSANQIGYQGPKKAAPLGA